MKTLPTTISFDDLHVLRVKGRAGDEALAHMLGVTIAEVEARRAPLVEAGVAEVRTGRLSLTSLTPAGREAHAAMLAERLGDFERRASIAATLDAFLPVNGDLKRLCTAWQTRTDGTPNLHDDADYDAVVVAQVAAVHDAVADVLRAGATAEPRLSRYELRLRDALSRLQSGDSTALLRPMSESYHDIWMELHEDLLILAGRQRSEADES